MRLIKVQKTVRCANTRRSNRNKKDGFASSVLVVLMFVRCAVNEEDIISR